LGKHFTGQEIRISALKVKGSRFSPAAGLKSGQPDRRRNLEVSYKFTAENAKLRTWKLRNPFF
jgi:hypothetical protein